ncbi:MAG TPA: hypothetical protein VE959_00720 [Bryobacteraceae bacterium]|nr:hypothetical protein [Bryobacteraceae bacterium]
MGQKRGGWRSLVVGLLGVWAANAAGTPQVPRHPQGVYVIVGANEAKDVDLLANNPAISGLMVYVEWSVLNPNPPTSDQLPASLDCHNLPTHNSSDPYDWSLTDAAFCAAASSSPLKTVQLVVRPGFRSPQWVLDQINTNSCSGQFVFLPQPYYYPSSPLPPFPPDPTPTCHLAYFAFDEGLSTPTINGVRQALYRPLPIPWDTTYKRAWQTFLFALAARYGQNPAFVSIAVAGPTAESDEILLPGDAEEIKEWSTILQNQFADNRYWNSDQAFIDEWGNAIDMYGRIFSDLTLVVTKCCEYGGGLPDFPVPYTPPSGAGAYCGSSPNMPCAAQYSIVSYFAEPGIGGRNAKAVEDDGLAAIPLPMGTTAVKVLTESAAQSTRILGGLQFGGGLPTPAFSLSEEQAWCPDATTAADPACSPQQAFYNALASFFDGTAAASLFPRLYDVSATSLFPTLAGGTKTGAAPLNYLQVYYGDITPASSAAVVNTGVGASPTYSVQDMLNLASQGLAQIAEQPLPLPPLALAGSAGPAAGSGASQTFTFTFSDTAGYQNLSVVDVLIASVLDGRQACYIAFAPSGANSGSVYLVDNAGDAGGPYSGMVLPGNGTVSNSQCSISGASSSAGASGNNLTLTLAITFSASFAGNKVTYLSAEDKTTGSTGWQELGTWNAGGATPAGPWVSGMSPASSNSSSGTYTFTFSDSKGWQDITVANVLIASAIDGRHACYLAFAPSGPFGGSVYLVDDAGDAGGPYTGLVLPSVGTASNSQCTVGGAGVAVAGSGNTLTLTLPIAFNAGFFGGQVFYLAARSSTLNSGWQAVGTVSVP